LLDAAHFEARFLVPVHLAGMFGQCRLAGIVKLFIVT
jgi:hypothetical protein